MRKFAVLFITLVVCACTHNEPGVPDRSLALDRNKPDTLITPEPKDSVFNEPADSIPELPSPLGERPEGSVIPDVVPDYFECIRYGVGYKAVYRIDNAKECGMLSATIYYGTDPDNLKPATTEFYAANGHIVANIDDMRGNTKYYFRCRITMATWYYETELKSYITLE